MLFIVLISFVIFNGPGLGEACSNLAGMFGATGIPFLSDETLYYLKSFLVLLVAGIIGATPLPRHLAEKLSKNTVGSRILSVTEPAALAMILLAVTAYLADGSFNPFLYFRF